jgi:hypothetical protein|tara:strand:- start:129 stop:428 length:300 start_codon:yes stop_codon:yes gene_type:complete
LFLFFDQAMGLCFGFARMGGMVSPLVCQDLPQRGMLGVTFVIMVCVAAIASVCTFLLSVETGGKQLTEGSENKDPRVIIKDGDDFSELSSEQGDSGNSI